ncbi:immunoglobulin I-set domain protein [Trichinella nativa]|uniref:Immunoglobulin I-set domain protein n=1 Tax=Trichinella nativa TaxID=6335 RepID=A0A1Y3E9A7_9BILA|nr:immunoglobulin I-set domain protein [Trichinella nativa]
MNSHTFYRWASHSFPRKTPKPMPLGFTSPHSSDRISAAESISYDDIGSALYFESELKDITSEAGTPVTFACKLVGDAERIVWRKDGQIMEEGDEFVQQYNSHNGWCKLTISEVFPEDQGIISCQAINKSNESVTSCFFTVQGKYLVVLSSADKDIYYC